MSVRVFRVPIHARGLPLAWVVLCAIGAGPWLQRGLERPFPALAVALAWFVAGFAIWRQRRELGYRWRIEAGAAERALGRDLDRIPADGLESLDWRGPFSEALAPWPAWLMVDRRGRGTRVSAWLEGGPEFLEALLDAADEPALRSWAEAKAMRRRIRGARIWLTVYWGIWVSTLAWLLWR